MNSIEFFSFTDYQIKLMYWIFQIKSLLSENDVPT